MEIDDLLQPVRIYRSQIKTAHRENCEAFYDSLVEQSGLDIDLNKLTIKKVKDKNIKIGDQKKILRRKKALRVILIILSVLAIVGAVILIVNGCQSDTNKSAKIIGGVCAAVAGVALFLIAIIAIGKSIKALANMLDKFISERDGYIKEAWGQMDTLNGLFDWGIPATLFTKTIPLIKLDPQFDEEKYQMLHAKYDFNGNPEKNISSVFVQSGSILGNPFLIEKNYVQEMADVPYTGSITITWTTTYTDKDGHSHTQTHTQTLTATIYKPAPHYYYDTMLVYGNDAVPNLSFSRHPTDVNKMNEKQIQKYVDSYDKKLDKLTQKSISTGKSFQRLGNNEFEALFNALDRDNNIDFRLMFTPLAQKNMIELVTSKEPYGDDFHFLKRKCLNYIKSEHSQTTDFEGDPGIFATYDYEAQKKFFLDYNDAFMRSLFFDLAPILSIPLYQQTASQEYIYEGVLPRNVTEMETEVMANALGVEKFRPQNSVTDVILKTSLISKKGSADLNRVTAYSFRTVEHIEYVSKFGGDGCFHNVPVRWLEYIPVISESEIMVQKCQTTHKEYDNNYKNGKFNEFLSQFTNNNDMIYKKGFISFLSSGNTGSYNGNELINILKKGDK